MQYPSSQGQDISSRPSRSQGSPWKGSQPRPADTRGPGTALPYGQGLKTSNLPKLGSTNSTMPNNQRTPSAQQAPSFAQAVQRAQQTAPGLRSTTKPPGVSGTPNQARNAPGLDESQVDSGAHILGSVNAQQMPRVNTSSGMSSLNTVLPGMSPAAVGTKVGDSRVASHTPETPGVQNLSLHERRPDSAAGHVKSVESDKYGLKSLLKVMDSSNKEKQGVILGSDLSQSGLNLGSSTERLSHTFASPWQETSRQMVIPDYKLPECYSIDNVVPQQQKLQNFDEGALFYIFYTMPRDAMQEAAAVELTNRSWRYHKELKMWLTKDPLSEPIQTNNQEESGIYIFFDPTTWKKIKREYVLYYPDIA